MTLAEFHSNVLLNIGSKNKLFPTCPTRVFFLLPYLFLALQLNAKCLSRLGHILQGWVFSGDNSALGSPNQRALSADTFCSEHVSAILDFLHKNLKANRLTLLEGMTSSQLYI